MIGDGQRHLDCALRIGAEREGDLDRAAFGGGIGVLAKGDGDGWGLDHVLHGDDEIRRVRAGAVAHLHRDLVGPVAVSVVGRLVVLGRAEREHARAGEAELGGVSSARLRPDQVARVRVAVVRGELGDRGLAFIDQEGTLTCDVGQLVRSRVHDCVRGGRNDAEHRAVDGAHAPRVGVAVHAGEQAEADVGVAVGYQREHVGVRRRARFHQWGDPLD